MPQPTPISERQEQDSLVLTERPTGVRRYALRLNRSAFWVPFHFRTKTCSIERRIEGSGNRMLVEANLTTTPHNPFPEAGEFSRLVLFGL
jgi:hypothetical protein